MHSRLCLRLASSRPASQIFAKQQRAPLTTSVRRCANDPARDLAQAINPTQAPRPDSEPISSRPPSEPSDASNTLLQGYPCPETGKMTTSRATPDSTTPESAPEARSTSNVALGTANSQQRARVQGDDATSQLMSLLPNPKDSKDSGRIRHTPNSPLSPPRPTRFGRGRSGGRDGEFSISDTKMLSQQPRRWEHGEVYAPHDLSAVEAQKNMMARRTSSARFVRPPGRRAGMDVLDALRIDPRKEYKNFSMMAEFVTEMGRIKSRAITGLRPINQRRMAKAVRRAIGIGLVPSVHCHPELMPERVEQRAYGLGRKGRGIGTF